MLKKKCAMCHNAMGVWPLATGGKACDGCKKSIQACEGTKAKPAGSNIPVGEVMKLRARGR